MLTELTGITADDAWPGRIAAVFGDIEVGVIGLTAFIANQRATGRLKDRADIEGLG